MSNQDDEFYVGYLPETPERIARYVRTVVAVLVAGFVVLALWLPTLQGRFDDGVFEWGNEQAFEGYVEVEPYATLRGAGPSQLLVRVGKLGAAEEVAAFAGRSISLRGTRIYGTDRHMIEIVRGSVEPASVGAPTARTDAPRAVDLGNHTLVGEIVDSKCYFGVMKPGRGKPHRACATRCISGGIPPSFLVESEGGDRVALLLTDAAGQPINREILDRVAEPLVIEGRVVQRGDLLYLQADPDTIRRR